MIRKQYYNPQEENTDSNTLNESSRGKQTAQYIADMLLELRHLSKCNGFTTLQGLLEISYYEAFNAAHKINVPAGEAEHLHQLGNDARKAFVA
jgi:hypothetical protein